MLDFLCVAFDRNRAELCARRDYLLLDLDGTAVSLKVKREGA
jgi:hypothetical protein